MISKTIFIGCLAHSSVSHDNCCWRPEKACAFPIQHRDVKAAEIIRHFLTYIQEQTKYSASCSVLQVAPVPTPPTVDKRLRPDQAAPVTAAIQPGSSYESTTPHLSRSAWIHPNRLSLSAGFSKNPNDLGTGAVVYQGQEE